jgi:hypothetical protein
VFSGWSRFLEFYVEIKNLIIGELANHMGERKGCALTPLRTSHSTRVLRRCGKLDQELTVVVTGADPCTTESSLSKFSMGLFPL